MIVLVSQPHGMMVFWVGLLVFSLHFQIAVVAAFGLAIAGSLASLLQYARKVVAYSFGSVSCGEPKTRANVERYLKIGRVS